MKKTWFNMAAVALESGGVNAQIDIHSEIGGWGVNAQSFMGALADLGDVKEINLSVHSPGGDVLEGWALYNAIKNHPANVIGQVEGLAGSMASVVLMACDEIRMPANSYMMIHNVAGGVFGGSDDLRSGADLIDKLSDGIADAYAERTGLAVDEIKALMDAETWMSGKEAQEKGFCDTVLDEVKAVACAELADYSFKNVPEAALSALTVETKEDEPGWVTKLANLVKGKDAENKAGLECVNTLRAEVTKLKAKITEKDAELNVAAVDLETVTNELEAVNEQVTTLENTAKETYEIISEAGFDAAGLNALPSAGGEGDGGESVYEKYKAIEDATKRREFFKANKDAILAEKDKVKG